MLNAWLFPPLAARLQRGDAGVRAGLPAAPGAGRGQQGHGAKSRLHAVALLEGSKALLNPAHVFFNYFVQQLVLDQVPFWDIYN